MAEKRYLKWYNKVGYGSGDIAGNVVYAFLTFFVMIYLSDTIGLNTGIVGTLMAVSKIFDGVSDVIFGSLIDKTKTKMGKARPWMLWPYLGCGVCLFAIFSIPTSWGQTAQYAFFFIFYVMLNAGFYTANNIAYSALTALITKNENERVQIGSLRFVFAFTTSTIIQAVTFGLVEHFGNDAAAWRIVALIYVIIGIISNTVSVLSMKELPEDEIEAKKAVDAPEEKYTLREAVGLLVKNKFYLLILGVYQLTQLYTAFTGDGTYNMTYVLGNKELMGYFASALNIPMIIGLLLVPTIVAKLGGMYKINYSGYALATIARILVIVAAYLGSVPMMLAFTAIASLGMCPLQGDLNAVIASASDYTYLTTGKRIDGTMYSCTSLGVKLGGGLGTAAAGWLLESGQGSCLGLAWVKPPMLVLLDYSGDE